jgi:hypothetical protein
MAKFAHFRLVVLIAAVLLPGLFLPAPAVAQMGGWMGGGGPGDFQSPITRRSITKYAEILNLDEDQKAAALALHDGYMEGVRAVQADMQKTFKEMQEKFSDTMDASVWRDAGKVFKPLQERTEALEKQYFADLQALLTDAQAERFPSVERARRRETQMRFSMVAGVRVDLFELASNLKLDQNEDVKQLLASYEVDLDRALVVRESGSKEMEAEGEKISEQAANMDFAAMNQSMNKMFKRLKELERPVREVNKTYARRMMSVLDEETGQKFDREFRRRGFPRIYKESHADKEFAAALGLEDLDERQRRELSQLQAGYLRERAAADQKWAAAVEEHDDKGEVNFMMFMGGGNQDNPVIEPRKNRRDLDRRTSEKIRSLLNEEQVAKLPKEPPRNPAEDALEMMGMDFDMEDIQVDFSSTSDGPG